MNRYVWGGAALTAVVSLLASASGAAAGGGDVADHITNRETVQAELRPDGSLKVARLFSQLVIDGDGSVRVVDPTATKNIRDLDGFSKPKTSNGNAIWDVDVHGRAVRRTVSDFTGDLPVSVSVLYSLNGRIVKPGDVVGKSGTLTVTYRIKNVTAEPAEVTYVDGRGVTRHKTVDVPTPYVGQLATTLPSRFGAIDAPRADVAGDGRGGTLLTWTMVLFEPIGAMDQEFGWSAHVTNGEIPKASVQVVPVPPKRKPELKFGEDGFSTGAAQATELTGGAGQIDGNVVKLRDGASDLLSGLGDLASGATDLKTGLNTQALPGAKDLASGLGDLSGGADQIAGGLRSADEGAQDALAGSKDLAAGADLVSGGVTALADGLDSLQAGLGELATEVAGLTSNPGYLALKAGIAALSAGLGSAADPLTILGALNAVEAGLVQLATSATAGLPAAKGGTDLVLAGLASAKTALQGLQAAVGGSIAEISGAYATLGCPGSLNPVCPLLDSALNSSHGLSTVTLPGLASLESGTDDAIAGLTAVSGGLAAAIAGIGSTSVPGNTLLYGLHQAILGLDHPAGAGGASDPGGVKQGVAAIGAGIDALVAGIVAAVEGALGTPTSDPDTTLRGGVGALQAGAAELGAGAAAVASGAGDLSSGLGDLASGVGQLDSGASDLADGATEAKSGADLLASGLSDAASGSTRIADGAGQARDGSKRIADGAGRLHTQGTSKLESQGNDTAADAALSYARLAKLDQKAAAGALPYGAPAGGEGSAAYLLTLNAANAQGTEDSGRAALAIGLLVLAALAGTLVHRRFATVTA